jgi:pyruvate dehydrogenase E2 component (dihydrolipoamide acetyltransferase)
VAHVPEGELSMGLYEFRMPDIGEGVAEGEVVAWLVKPGDEVREDQEMVEVMTDKATVTIGAPKPGRIARLNAVVGERVRVGSVLVVIETSSDVDPRAPSQSGLRPEADIARSRFQAPARPQAQGSTRPSRSRGTEAPREDEVVASAVGDIRSTLPGADVFARLGQRGREGALREAPKPPGPALVPAPVARPRGEKPLATPATRKLARDLGVDLQAVPATGEHGRITKDDVHTFLHARAPGSGARSTGSRREERRPFVGLRRRIAERMRLAKSTAAHFTFVEEAEVDALVALIERMRPQAEARGVRLQLLPFVVKAVTLALKQHPQLNSMLDESTSELVTRFDYHVGIATATEQGLVVPVVRHADNLSVLAIASEIARLAEGARKHTLSPGELSGSTFTITSLGKLGGLLATPVLNHPEVGILGVHRIKERPVVRGGQIVVGKVMNLSLSFDHRIIDGHVGAAFAYDVIKYLEQPELMLLELA